MINRPAMYCLVAGMLCAGLVAGAPLAGQVARFGLARARVHLRLVWRALLPLVEPAYAHSPGPRAIHLDSPVRPHRVTFINGHTDPFTLDELRGYGVLLFFGTLDCNSDCLYALKQFTHVKAALGDHARRVRFVMIGVDAGHGRSSSLLRLVRSYSPDFMALTANAQTVVPFARKHGATVIQVSGYPNKMTIPLIPYLVYLNPDGVWTTCFPLDLPAEEIADEIIYSL